MNGPQLLCAGCGEPTTVDKPICDDCCRLAGVEPMGYCALCKAMFNPGSTVLAAIRGVHMTKDGGYAGRCTV